MVGIPTTSITLLKAISDSAESVRWTEFYNTYRPHMLGFLCARFPSVDPEDAIQEAMVALMGALPGYHYTPDEKGHFRNYLMGVLAHKASDMLKKSARHSSILAGIRSGYGPASSHRGDADDQELEAWKASAMEAAMEQLMSDDSIRPTTREVFRHVALMHESPEHVAAIFGITRNNVDQIKKRLIDKLAATVKAMTSGELRG